MKKAQAAMEYLMTYGWAILVIAVIFAILFIIIRPFGSQEICMPQQQGFVCEGLRIVIDTNANTARLYAKITNGLYKPITVTQIACTNEDTSGQQNYIPVNEIVPSNGNIQAIWGTTQSQVTCKGVQKGTTYTGKIFIKYREQDAPTGVPEKELVVNIVTTPQ